jgi:hypothetical protein
MSNYGQLLDHRNVKNIAHRPQHPRYGKEWERLMIQGTGDLLKVQEIKK